MNNIVKSQYKEKDPVKTQRKISQKYQLGQTDRTLILIRGVSSHSEIFSKREGNSVNKLLKLGILEKKPVILQSTQTNLTGFFNYSLTSLGWEIHDQIFTNKKV